MKVAEVKANAALSRLIVCEMELEALCSKLSGKEAEMQEIMKMLKDAAFEEVEVASLEQVEHIKLLVCKQGYDVGLSDADVPDDSLLSTNYAVQPEDASSQSFPPEVPKEDQAMVVGSLVVRC